MLYNLQRSIRHSPAVTTGNVQRPETCLPSGRAHVFVAAPSAGSRDFRCRDLQNTREIAGRIVLVDRGSCFYIEKVILNLDQLSRDDSSFPELSRVEPSFPERSRVGPSFPALDGLALKLG